MARQTREGRRFSEELLDELLWGARRLPRQVNSSKAESREPSLSSPARAAGSRFAISGDRRRFGLPRIRPCPICP